MSPCHLVISSNHKTNRVTLIESAIQQGVGVDATHDSWLEIKMILTRRRRRRGRGGAQRKATSPTQSLKRVRTNQSEYVSKPKYQDGAIWLKDSAC